MGKPAGGRTFVELRIRWEKGGRMKAKLCHIQGGQGVKPWKTILLLVHWAERNSWGCPYKAASCVQPELLHTFAWDSLAKEKRDKTRFFFSQDPSRLQWGVLYRAVNEATPSIRRRIWIQCRVKNTSGLHAHLQIDRLLWRVPRPETILLLFSDMQLKGVTWNTSTWPVCAPDELITAQLRCSAAMQESDASRRC